MIATLKAGQVKFWNWMRNSGTIAWSRLQVLLGALFAVLSVTDLSPLPIFKDHPDWLLYWMIVNGFISEYIRRRGTEVVQTQAYVPDVGHVDVVKLVDTNVAPPPKG
ncbi:hypothetical protein LRP30_13680 [Bradyrhizobium sp. C-145]|uniref:hypothetical protein n=1 Tax=Bradyrhizobium sp. C-145 TaxID=574727 RepID=UPI00201B4AC0|nr:hypothetical protein [Bradyrhizobium sp. C-145]UQR66233.1 hypothetical protein LRP30_13680 [Bradyrhizobium sp. C-145]